jgi:hypothetical protein
VLKELLLSDILQQSRMLISEEEVQKMANHNKTWLAILSPFP